MELITLTVLRLVISHARWPTSLGQAGCCIVTRPFFSGRVGSGHKTMKLLVIFYCAQTSIDFKTCQWFWCGFFYIHVRTCYSPEDAVSSLGVIHGTHSSVACYSPEDAVSSLGVIHGTHSSM